MLKFAEEVSFVHFAPHEGNLNLSVNWIFKIFYSTSCVVWRCVRRCVAWVGSLLPFDWEVGLLPWPLATLCRLLCGLMRITIDLGIWRRIRFPLGGGWAMEIGYTIVSVPCAEQAACAKFFRCGKGLRVAGRSALIGGALGGWFMAACIMF
jgi:hypothetical protein